MKKRFILPICSFLLVFAFLVFASSDSSFLTWLNPATGTSEQLQAPDYTGKIYDINTSESAVSDGTDWLYCTTSSKFSKPTNNSPDGTDDLPDGTCTELTECINYCNDPFAYCINELCSCEQGILSGYCGTTNTDSTCNDYCSYIGSPYYGALCVGSLCTCTNYADTSTPYLFSNVNGNYLIENDFMNTFFQADGMTIEDTEKAYKNNEVGTTFSENEIYLIKNNPTVVDNKLKLQIKELEPEESNIDQIKLFKVVHDKNTAAFASDTIYGSKSELRNAQLNEFEPISCIDNNGEDCLASVLSEDKNYLQKDYGDYIILKFKPSVGDNYLYINSWLNEYVPEFNKCEKFGDYEKCYMSEKIAVYVPGGDRSLKFSLSKNSEWNQIGQDFHTHGLRSGEYRQIPVKEYVDKDGFVTLKIEWTAEHIVDKISIMDAATKPYKIETLKLISAKHSKDGEVKDKLNQKDFNYAHTVRGDTIDLEFDAGTLEPDENEAVDYFFESKGFYYGLRTYLYPNVDTSDSYKEEIINYVNELNNYLKTQNP